MGELTCRGSDSHVKGWSRVPVEQYLDTLKLQAFSKRVGDQSGLVVCTHSIEVTLAPPLCEGLAAYFLPVARFEGSAIRKALKVHAEILYRGRTFSPSFMNFCDIWKDNPCSSYLSSPLSLKMYDS